MDLFTYYIYLENHQFHFRNPFSEGTYHIIYKAFFFRAKIQGMNHNIWPYMVDFRILELAFSISGGAHFMGFFPHHT